MRDILGRIRRGRTRTEDRSFDPPFAGPNGASGRGLEALAPARSQLPASLALDAISRGRQPAKP